MLRRKVNNFEKERQALKQENLQLRTMLNYLLQVKLNN